MVRATRILPFAVMVGMTTLLTSCGSDPSIGTPVSAGWVFRIDSLGVGESEGWFKPGADRSTWRSVPVPAHWDTLGLESYDGAGWYAVKVGWHDPEPPAVVFDGVDDDAVVWIDGVQVGSHTGYSEAFVVTAAKRPTADSVLIVVRVVDHSGPGGIYGRVRVAPASRAEALMRSPLASREARPSADWVKSAVVYEVYVRAFSPEGTFRGLTARLPELRDLGVTVLWLMPIHPVGMLNRKGSLGSPYAVADYDSVNPEFGTMADFRELVSGAHDLGMKVIIDLVANHTAWDSRLLTSHPEWYTHDAEGAIVSPNVDWTDVADLNYDSHELRKYMIAMMGRWVRVGGIDGFRCDVAELVPTEFWETARRELDAIKPVMMLSEGTLPEHHLEAFDATYAWTLYDLLDPLFHGTGKASWVTDMIRRESERFPRGSLRLRFATNHDKNTWDAPADEKFGRDGARLAGALSFTLPGIPLIYNGEEIGSRERLSLFERTPIDWSRGDNTTRKLFQTLSRLRALHPWLATGPYRALEQNGGEKVLAFARTDGTGTQAVVAAFNFGPREARIAIPLPNELSNKLFRDVVTGASSTPTDTLRLRLGPRGFIVYTEPE